MKTLDDLKASPEVLNAVSVLRSEIDRIWEMAWRTTFKALQDGINPDEFVPLLNSNPVFASLFIEMQDSVYVWIRAGMSVDQIPPAYSVKREKLENLFLEVWK